ncbi:pilus assembly protein [Nocardioides sp. GY 10113]|uniref:TadE/TadG family type IV pilus assembly protein n=1 Tax=Nocardioides sp. GY 10113 TaxID=2569761 RepID=UPI0010A89677|nr:TadE/TadG family type IV pilus assembly protein [Nocardioides sp. GY 10113]TIC87537.1 pilus assembly protein [Nocardioides sp. GY 10113]
MTRHRRTARGRAARGRAERGSALVDFVLAIVVLVPVFLGLVQVALVLHVRATLAAAAAEGARLAATADRGPADGVARTWEQVRAARVGGFATAVTPGYATVDGAPVIEIVVHAEVPALGLGGPAVAFDVAGHAVREGTS